MSRTLLAVNGHALPRLFEWSEPDLRSEEQIEADEALDKLMRAALQATRPPPPGPQLVRLIHERIATREEAMEHPASP
ncbi:hypothetical protein ACFV3E_05815 [Streptomyces sp. NPDC059718]